MGIPYRRSKNEQNANGKCCEIQERVELNVGRKTGNKGKEGEKGDEKAAYSY